MKAIFFYSKQQAKIGGVCKIDGQPYTECKTGCFDADPDPKSNFDDAAVVARYEHLPLDVFHYETHGTHHAYTNHLPIVGKPIRKNETTQSN